MMLSMNFSLNIEVLLSNLQMYVRRCQMVAQVAHKAHILRESDFRFLKLRMPTFFPLECKPTFVSILNSNLHIFHAAAHLLADQTIFEAFFPLRIQPGIFPVRILDRVAKHSPRSLAVFHPTCDRDGARPITPPTLPGRPHPLRP